MEKEKLTDFFANSNNIINNDLPSKTAKSKKVVLEAGQKYPIVVK